MTQTQTQTQTKKLKMMVACTNANGESDLFVTTVEATSDQVLDGLHYEMAESKAADADYRGPFVAFDDHDQRNIARQVPELDEPVTVPLKDQSKPDGDRMPVYLTLQGGQVHIKAKGFQQCQSATEGGLIATLELDGGSLRLIAYSDINRDEPTQIIGFDGAANDQLGKASSEWENTLNVEAALAALDEEPDNRLWEVEVGLFDAQNDPNTAVSTHLVIVASGTRGEADDLAVEIAEENIPCVSGMTFFITNEATEVDPDDYR